MTPQTVVKETAVNVFEEIAWGTSISHGDVEHPWQITELWTDEELELINVYRVPLAVVPGDKIVKGFSFARDADDKVVQVLDLEDAPLAPVTPRQIRRALSQIGVRQAIEDWVQTQGITVQDSWQYATEVTRDNALVIAACATVGKTDADLDALFALARTL